MRLSELLAQACITANEAQAGMIWGDADVGRLSSDTRSLQPGEIFVCMPSPSRDTHEFMPEAQQKGAAAALVHTDAGFEWAQSLQLPAAWIRQHEFSEALWRIAKIAFGNPSAHMRLIGVTGTNGKTTTTWLIRDALRALGRRSGYLGTLGFQIPGEERELSNTTPFSVELNRLLAEAVEAGTQDFAMEVSSYALEERRADGVEFDVGVFTNLTQDHLDYHGTMDAYGAAKLRLFTDLPKQTRKRFVAAINADEPTGSSWLTKLEVPAISFGLANGDLRGSPSEVKVDRLTLDVTYGADQARLEAKLGGSYNVENCLSALAGLVALGMPLEEAVAGLREARPVPGRFEAVPNGRGIGILVDYAHTPDALEKLLDAVRPLTAGRVIAVFGCGGDRDRTKRPLMARAVSSRADLSVITSDNPRTEDPNAIVKEIEAGIQPGAEFKTVVDRRDAVAFAVSQAKPGDVVVIAGKGHENYQIIGRTKHPMDDRELAKEALKAVATG